MRLRRVAHEAGTTTVPNPTNAYSIKDFIQFIFEQTKESSVRLGTPNSSPASCVDPRALGSHSHPTPSLPAQAARVGPDA